MEFNDHMGMRLGKPFGGIEKDLQVLGVDPFDTRRV
jgi:hypothetical protein